MELYNKSIKKKEKINKDVQLIFSQRLNMEFLPQIAQIYADLKPPKVVYW